MEQVTYEGWDNCVRLSNDAAEVIVTTLFGPRVIHFGRLGGPNAFQVIPATRGKVVAGKWLPYGGHRLWHAPEVMPRSYQPDNEPVSTVELHGKTLHVGIVEQGAGIGREMRITLAPEGPSVKVEHRLTNRNVWGITLAPWSLNIVANGGRVVVPQEPSVFHDDDLLPARPTILWKFTDMADPRWRWGNKYITLREDADVASAQKVGVWNTQAWAAHVTSEQVFVVSVDAPCHGPAHYADFGCNYEVYTEGAFQELETLGPLQTLEPGETAVHNEFWFLAPAVDLEDTDDALDAGLLPIAQQASDAARALGRIAAR